jgi:autotransporter-associated beta strand protein
MKPKSTLRSVLAAIGGSVLAISCAHAATYSWSDLVNGTAVSANWSTGTNWNAAPVSAASTTLNFTMTFGSNSTAETNTLTNDVANPFLLNVLTLAAAPTAFNGSSVATVNIAGSALNFVDNVAVAPVVNLNANRSNGQLVTYNVQNDVTLGNNLTFQGNGTATFNFSGIISGSGFGITKSGTSALTLSGANDCSAGTSINAGTLTINSAGTLGQNLNTNNVSLAAGTRLNLSAAGNTGANQTITLTSTAASLATLGIGYNGIPAATIAQADTNGGVIAINAVTGYNQNLSTLLTGKNLFLGGIGTSTFTGAAGTVVAGNGSTYRLGGGGGSISFNTANLFTGANAVQIGSAATGGTGTVIMGATQDYTGTTTISGGTLSVSAANRLGGASADLVFDGGTLQVTGTALTSLTSLGRTNPVVFNATKTVGLDIADVNNTFTVGQVLNQTTGGFTKSGAGTAVLDQNNTFTGAVTVGAGTLVLSGDNAIAGAVNLNGGTLRLQNINAIDTATGVTALTGTTLQLRSDTAATFATPLTTLSTTGTSSMTLDVNRVSSGSGNQLILNGGLFASNAHGNVATLNFTGGNSYTLSIPTLRLEASSSGGAGGGLALNPTTTSVAIGALNYPVSNKVQLLELGGSSAGNTMGAITRTGSITLNLIKHSASTWRLTGSSNYAGSSTIRTGTLLLGADAPSGSNGTLGNATSAVVLGDGSTAAGGAPALLIDGAFTVGRAITVGSLTNTAAYNATIGGSNTTGTSSFTGNITLNTTATNYTTTLRAATGGTTQFSTGTWSTNNKAIAIGSSGNTGTVRLNNAIATSGGINVNFGTLELNSAFTGGNLAVANGATLSGNGSIGGEVTVNGTLSPGNSIDSIDVGNLAFGSTGSYSVELDATSVTGDQTSVTGTVTINATTSLTPPNVTGTLAAGQKYFIVVNDDVDVVNGTFAGFGQDTIVGTYGGIDLKISYTGDSVGGTISGGNDIVLYTDAGGDPYLTWSGAADFDTDTNGDGVKNGLAWLLGAADKNANAVGLLPKVTQSGGNLVMNFTCLKLAGRGTATLNLQHSSDLGISDAWASVAVPDTAITVGVVNYTVPTTNANLNLVDLQATIPVSEAAAGKLFGRLKATE